MRRLALTAATVAALAAPAAANAAPVLTISAAKQAIRAYWGNPPSEIRFGRCRQPSAQRVSCRVAFVLGFIEAPGQPRQAQWWHETNTVLLRSGKIDLIVQSLDGRSVNVG